MSLKISEAFGQGSSDIWFRVQTDHDAWKALHARRKKVSPLKGLPQKIAA
jgi:plasmid maintenance system antidote protein VapI